MSVELSDAERADLYRQNLMGVLKVAATMAEHIADIYSRRAQAFSGDLKRLADGGVPIMAADALAAGPSTQEERDLFEGALRTADGRVIKVPPLTDDEAAARMLVDP